MSYKKYFFILPLVLTCCSPKQQAKPAPAPKPKEQPKKEEAPVEQNCTNPELREGQTLNVSLNLKNGKYIQLSDESVWKINPTDVPVTSAWLTPAQIRISKSSNSNYPCLLTNQQTYSSVSARRLASIDEAE